MGLTQQAIVHLRWTDLDLTAGLVRLPGAEGHAAREAPLPPEAIALLRALTQTKDRVFPIGHSQLQLACGNACEKAGIRALPFNTLRRVLQRSRLKLAEGT
jgi:integrase